MKILLSTVHAPPRHDLLITLVLILASSPALWAWGDLGHQTIAQIAQQRLTATTAQKVSAILAGEDIAVAAVWPDKIRCGSHPGPLAFTQEGTNFHSAHPDNALWHFLDLPLSTTSFNPNAAFVDPDDNVVVAMGLCIDVLEGNSQVMSKLHALRWLIHLTGDIHQPLHVACGYYRWDDQDDPHLVRTGTAIVNQHLVNNSDHGANKLRYTDTQRLHAYWDGVLITHIDSPGTPLKTALENRIAQGNYQNTTSNYRKWPARWAMASALVSRGIYDRIVFQDKKYDTDGWYITIAHPSPHQPTEVPIAADQLAKAAFNLAEILNRIHWQ